MCALEPAIQAFNLAIKYLETLRDSGVTQVIVTQALLADLSAYSPPRVLKVACEKRPNANPSANQMGTGNEASQKSSAQTQSKERIQLRETDFVPLFRYQSVPLLGLDQLGKPEQRELSKDEKARALEELRREVLKCAKCPHLARTRKNVVFGVGNVSASLMFVGEAPGVEEDEQGEPFVGKAGQLLTKIIQAMGFSREIVYIGNVLKCRPDTPPGASGNRKPTFEEMRTCVPYLERQILIIRPKVIVALGATAVEGLFEKRNVQITKIRGHWLEWNRIPVMPTYHPSYLLRNPSVAVKREVWEDMLKVMEMLGLPITEKQRNYFKR